MVAFRPRRERLTDEKAREIALDALLFLIQDPDRLAHFMTATGVTAGELRRRADDPEMLAAALEFLAQDESALLTFTANAGHPAEWIQPTLALLRGEHPGT